MKFSSIALLVGVLFILTYNPKTGSLDRYLSTPAPSQEPQAPSGTCCNSTDYRAENNKQCRSAYYQGLQFGDPDYGCPVKDPQTCLGAII